MLTNFNPNDRNIFLPPQSGNFSSVAMLMVMIYEAIKGIIALVFGFWLISWHDRLIAIATPLMSMLNRIVGYWITPQLNEVSHLAEDANTVYIKVVGVILTYAIIRLIEAYGLYRDRTWAYWLSLVGYAIFLPIELYFLFTKSFDSLSLGVFLINIIVVFVIYVSMKEKGLLGKVVSSKT